MSTSYYVHDIDPVLFHVVGPLSVRWYGLSYLVGFICGYFLWRHLSRKGLFPVPEDELADFVSLFAVFAVMLGGRLGYVLFYGMGDWLEDPLFPFKIWEGGMASHGGIIGAILFVAWYSRKHGYRYWDVMDGIACATPIGLFFGRIANFINGELWGRVTEVPWAVIFPATGDGLPRHPSQLYQALGEGLLLFLFLWWVRLRTRRYGLVSVLFLLGYGIARIGAEFFREPDAHIGLMFGWLTRGQLLSFSMLIGAVVLAFWLKVYRQPIKQ